MNKNKVYLDEVIAAGVKQNIENGLKQDIDLDVEWKKFEKKYYGSKIMSIKKYLAICACALMLSFIILNLLYPSEVKATGLKTRSFFNSFFTGKVQTIGMDYQDKYNKNIPDQEYNKFISKDYLEKLNSLPFRILLPIEFLGNYRVATCDISELGDSYDVRLVLSNSENKTVQIRQISITTGFAEGIALDKEDVVHKKVRINGQEATLIVYKDNTILIKWIADDLFVSLKGKEEDELLSIANSMRHIH
jgi:hypothetical protein